MTLNFNSCLLMIYIGWRYIFIYIFTEHHQRGQHKKSKEVKLTYGHNISSSSFFVTKVSSAVSVSTWSGLEHCASSSSPHSSVLTKAMKPESYKKKNISFWLTLNKIISSLSIKFIYRLGYMI